MTHRNWNWRALGRRLLSLVGIGAAGAGLAALGGSQVFAHQYLQGVTPQASPEMIYDSELQLMVRPGTREPIFIYSHSLKAQQLAELVTKVDPPPPPPPPPTNTVKDDNGPNGAGPTHDA